MSEHNEYDLVDLDTTSNSVHNDTRDVSLSPEFASGYKRRYVLKDTKTVAVVWWRLGRSVLALPESTSDESKLLSHLLVVVAREEGRKMRRSRHDGFRTKGLRFSFGIRTTIKIKSERG